MKLKYEVAFWTWCVAVMLAIALAFSIKTVSAEASRHLNFDCTGYKVSLISTPYGTWNAAISFEEGSWVEVPPNGKSDVLKLINLDNQRLTVMGIQYPNQVYIQIYRSLDAYNAKLPDHSLQCRKD